MLKFLNSLLERLNEPADFDGSDVDLLQHPAIARMSERELADLPLHAVAKRNAGQTNCPA